MTLEQLEEKAHEIEKADDDATHQKWLGVRKEALEFLSEKRERWQRLQNERQSRLSEVAIYVVFVVLVTIVALTSRNTEVRSLQPRKRAQSLKDLDHVRNNMRAQDAFWMSSGLRGSLQDSEFPPNNVSNTEKSFSSIATVQELSMSAQRPRSLPFNNVTFYACISKAW